MASPSAEEFIAALRRVEEDGDVEAMAALYAGEAQLRSPSEHDSLTGPDGARRFWTAYRHSFEHVRSRFHSVLEGDTRIMLEWTSDCRTAAGVDTSYGGVSVVETRDGRIVRFQAYFDPAELHAAPSLETGMRPVGHAPMADRGTSAREGTNAGG
jgi:ketosteroid isomerase-like protein